MIEERDYYGRHLRRKTWKRRKKKEVWEKGTKEGNKKEI